MKGLALVSSQVLEDWFWSRAFGRVQKEGIVWKYGNPWLYPADEFEQLKTIILVTRAVESTSKEEAKLKKVEVPEHIRLQNLARSKAMYSHLSRGPLV